MAADWFYKKDGIVSQLHDYPYAASPCYGLAPQVAYRMSPNYLQFPLPSNLRKSA